MKPSVAGRCPPDQPGRFGPGVGTGKVVVVLVVGGTVVVVVVDGGTAVVVVGDGGAVVVVVLVVGTAGGQLPASAWMGEAGRVATVAPLAPSPITEAAASPESPGAARTATPS